MSLALRKLFSNSPSRSTLSFSTTTFSSPSNNRTLYPLPISRCLSCPKKLTHLSLPLAFFKAHHPTRRGVYGSQAAARSDDVLGGFDLDAFLSIAELLCIVSSVAVLSIGFLANLVVLSSSMKAVLVEMGNRASVWGVVFLAVGAAIGAWIRRRQWRGVCRETLKGTVHVNLLERVEKLEEDLQSSTTIIRVLSRQLEKLGLRFRVTRKALKKPLAETAALTQKNSKATQALAVQEDILEKELGEIQKVLLAMQEQQQKQLELILAIGKTGKLWESKPVRDRTRYN